MSQVNCVLVPIINDFEQKFKSKDRLRKQIYRQRLRLDTSKYEMYKEKERARKSVCYTEKEHQEVRINY